MYKINNSDNHYYIFRFSIRAFTVCRSYDYFGAVMKKGERIFWIIFYVFPVVANICIVTYLLNAAIDVVRSNTKIDAIKTNDEKKNHCVKYYYSWNSKIKDYTNTYTFESSGSRSWQDEKRFFTRITYSKKDVFFEYYFDKPEPDSQQINESSYISYDEDHHELIVRYNIPEYLIKVKKDEIHGIRVNYRYEKESVNE